MLHSKVTRIGRSLGQTYAFSPISPQKFASGVGLKRKTPSIGSKPTKVVKVLASAVKNKSKNKKKVGLKSKSSRRGKISKTKSKKKSVVRKTKKGKKKKTTARKKKSSRKNRKSTTGKRKKRTSRTKVTYGSLLG